MSIVEIKQMSNKERLTTMEQLWDALCHQEQEPESPNWHADVLEARRMKMDSPDARYFTIDELRKTHG
jgi:hypothetical protein